MYRGRNQRGQVVVRIHTGEGIARGPSVPCRLVNIRISRILVGMQERAEEAGLDLSGDSFVLARP